MPAASRAIRLTLGPFSGVVPDCVQMYLDVLAKGTIAEGAKIEARTLPLRVQCRACGQISEIDRRHIACPACGSVDLHRLRAGNFWWKAWRWMYKWRSKCCTRSWNGTTT